jgi:biotin transport system substrate-specific component
MRHHRSLALDSHNATFLATALRADSPGLVVTTRVAAVLLMTVLTAAAAQFSMPLWFTPVPFTVQPMVVLLGGALLGPWLGAASQLLYLALGLAGVPVFAASAILPQGPARLAGPTGGYLMSYPLAAFVSGWLAMRGFDRRYLTSVLAMAAGLVVVFVGGVLWLARFTSPAGNGISAALDAGFYPFVVADLFKLCVAASILPALWRFTGLGRRA